MNSAWFRVTAFRGLWVLLLPLLGLLILSDLFYSIRFSRFLEKNSGVKARSIVSSYKNLRRCHIPSTQYLIFLPAATGGTWLLRAYITSNRFADFTARNSGSRGKTTTGWGRVLHVWVFPYTEMLKKKKDVGTPPRHHTESRKQPK